MSNWSIQSGRPDSAMCSALLHIYNLIECPDIETQPE